MIQSSWNAPAPWARWPPRPDGDDAARAELLFRRCLTRPPSSEERAQLVQFYQAQLARFTGGELKATEIMDAKNDRAFKRAGRLDDRRARVAEPGRNHQQELKENYELP